MSRLDTFFLLETQGLTDILIECAQRYHLPLLITENGCGWTADPIVKAKYIVQNIVAVHSAMNQGSDVLGYLYWTLDYDYEWTSGYKQNYGLFYVDDFTAPSFTEPTAATDFARTTVQPAVDVYSAIAEGNGISTVIIDLYGR
ncbi:MAG: family 1 glycosylhydrolase [Deltaproteobacteria bacterium]|nr:family 1 glycosylhydrolase [Deltaproteobacteria bacterium]MCL5277417.1 family 1 glycosylhydrolase [Deltaproteobacteria bacterium]